MILRIEDTDQKRYVKGAEEYVNEALQWCGIHIDEGVKEGGDFGPYRQSGRQYKEFADRLIKNGDAYYAFDTPEELNALRTQKEKEQSVFTYNAEFRNRLKNSLNLPGDEVQSRIKGGQSYVIRFRVPEDETLEFQDIVRGTVSVETATLDDKILFKSDGLPTYHLANVVDDHLMEISHVIRGEEWLPSLPLHILLYRAFGWDPPEFAHMPLTLKPDGKGKLSKRDGDRLGFPVFPLEWKNPDTGEISSGYREAGYFPEAFINILAFLGWNPGTTQELFTMEELIDAFSLERIIKAGSRFDPGKARWFNQQYLRKKSNEELADLFRPSLEEKNIAPDHDYLVKVCGLIKERVSFIDELWEHSWFFFKRPEAYDEKIIGKRWKKDTPGHIQELINLFEDSDSFISEYVESLVKDWITKNGLNMGQILSVCRLLLMGAGTGPHLFDSMALLGREETMERFRIGMNHIQKEH